ncbi:uncharacterized protein LOC129912647 [Episyrphus balteatus]|uniref:uncharacterized protein LOC129912647 n=1 Tax=Episyrphus balteatus TaxID=286459 RepID=UPI0024861FAE|nr:uncharacterized protein LOC129912647 [Episyrphus balteatus]
MAFTILAVGLLFFTDYAIGSCGTCQNNSVACQSLTTFSLCIDDVPRSDEIIDCPEGSFCTDKPTICVKNTNSSFEASCGIGCDVCNSHDNVFSCMDPWTAVFCFGAKKPFPLAKSICPKGYVCDLSNREVCVKKSPSMASCIRNLQSTTKLPDSTPRSPRDATTFCRENAMEGTFPAEGDTTCKRYYICQAISNGAKFMGYSYACSGNDYFDPIERLCTRKRPISC